MTDEQAAAFAVLRAHADPFRYRVKPDAEGFPTIPGQTGIIEWFCSGSDCHGCPIPGVALAVYSRSVRLFGKLWAIPGVHRWQVGDVEMRAVFPPEALEQVAGVIRARRRRTQVSPGSLANLRPRPLSHPQARAEGASPPL